MFKLTMLGTTLALAAGCYRGDTGTKTPTTPPTTPPVETKPEAFSAASVLFGDKSAGLMEGTMTATVEFLTPKMPGYRIELKDDAAFTGFSAFSAAPHLNVYVGDERVFAVVIHEGGKIFNAHTDNKHVGVQGHPAWHVGAAFQDSRALSRCDCWGDKVVCWKDGEHAALAFDRSCDNLANLGNDQNQAALKVLDGLEIKRMVWSPQPFEPDHTDTPSQPKGGGLTGTVVPHEHPTQGDEDGDEGGGEDDGD